MPYQFATEDQDYSDYSSGRVIYSLAGAPAFPVRLACEIFLRAQYHLGESRRLHLYDPCCGGAYHLTTLGFLHGPSIASILASDIDHHALDLARRNLSLLTPAGLLHREQELNDLYRLYNKESHAQALGSVIRLAQRLRNLPGGTLPSRVFQANGLDSAAIGREIQSRPPDLVISDIPYGWMTGWQTPGAVETDPRQPAAQLLEALLPWLPSGALVAIASDKRQRVAHDCFRRVERFQIGKREITYLRPGC